MIERKCLHFEEGHFKNIPYAIVELENEMLSDEKISEILKEDIESMFVIIKSGFNYEIIMNPYYSDMPIKMKNAIVLQDVPSFSFETTKKIEPMLSQCFENFIEKIIDEEDENIELDQTESDLVDNIFNKLFIY